MRAEIFCFENLKKLKKFNFIKLQYHVIETPYNSRGQLRCLLQAPIK